MASKYPQKICRCNALQLPHKHEDGGIVEAQPEEMVDAVPRKSGVGFTPAR
jgi:hypothetical protein